MNVKRELPFNLENATYLEMITFLREKGYTIIQENSIWCQWHDGCCIKKKLYTTPAYSVRHLKEWITEYRRYGTIRESDLNG